jgi:CheY-like chemotaxis protein
MFVSSLKEATACLNNGLFALVSLDDKVGDDLETVVQFNKFVSNQTKLVQNMTNISNAINVGDFSARITAPEHPQLETAINKSMETLSEFFSATTKVVQQFGDGDNYARVLKNYSGDMQQLSCNINSSFLNRVQPEPTIDHQISNLVDSILCIDNSPEMLGSVLEMKSSFETVTETMEHFNMYKCMKEIISEATQLFGIDIYLWIDPQVKKKLTGSIVFQSEVQYIIGECASSSNGVNVTVTNIPHAVSASVEILIEVSFDKVPEELVRNIHDKMFKTSIQVKEDRIVCMIQANRYMGRFKKQKIETYPQCIRVLDATRSRASKEFMKQTFESSNNVMVKLTVPLYKLEEQVDVIVMDNWADLQDFASGKNTSKVLFLLPNSPIERRKLLIYSHLDKRCRFICKPIDNLRLLVYIHNMISEHSITGFDKSLRELVSSTMSLIHCSDPPTPNIRILHAEDNKIFQKRLQKDVSNKYRIIAVTNGEDAVSLYKIHKQDIILLDGVMPKLSGPKAAHLIRENEIDCMKKGFFTGRVPIIHVGTEKHYEKGRMSFDDHVTKDDDEWGAKMNHVIEYWVALSRWKKAVQEKANTGGLLLHSKQRSFCDVLLNSRK